MEQPPDPTKERDQRNEAISKVILAKDVTLMQMDKLSSQIGEPFAQHSDIGVYQCARCGNALFDSDQKIKAEKYPTFRKTVAPNAVKTSDDFSYGLTRVAVYCKKCSLPLGHKYPEGKAKERFVVLSCALKFVYGVEEQGGSTSRSVNTLEEPSRMKEILPWIAVPAVIAAVLVGLWIYKHQQQLQHQNANAPEPPLPPPAK